MVPSPRRLALAALALCACATAPRQPFPTDAFASAQGGPAVATVESDGHVIFAGEGDELGYALARLADGLTRARASGATTAGAFRTFVAELDRALSQGRPPRLSLLRAETACELALQDERSMLPPELVREVETRQMHLALLLDAGPDSSRPWRPGAEMGYPVQPPVVTSFFGLRQDPIDGRPRYHLGVDLEAAEGQQVHAAADGVVVSAGWAGGHGNRVELMHPGGLVTGYSHLSAYRVQPGTRVHRGDVVGLAGHTGRATGPHVHFEVWRDGEPDDPLDLLPDRGAVSVRADVPLE